MLSLPREYVSGCAHFPEFLEYAFFSLRGEIKLGMNISSVSTMALQLLNLLDPRHTHHPRGFQYSNQSQTLIQVQNNVESELVECGKSIFFAKSAAIDAELQFLARNYPTRKFYKGKEILAKVSFGWKFYDEGMSKVPKYFKYLMENGIYLRLRKEQVYQKYLHRKPAKLLETEPLTKAVGLNAAILTLFILCWGTLLGACVVFIAEIRRKIYTLIERVLRNSLHYIYDKCSLICARKSCTKISSWD